MPHSAPQRAAPASRRYAPCCARQARSVRAAAAGAKDGPVGAWLDLAALITSGAKAPGVSDFARDIGSDIYVDIAGWHLFLRDMKYDVGLANAIAARTASNGGKISSDDVTAILKKVAVKLGGGKTEVSLYDVMGSRCVEDLVELSQRFAKEL
jgi:hypothetical protein